MKKTLLTLAAFSFITFASAQATISQNFDGLTIGNIGTDLTGAVAGQGGLFTRSNNGATPTTGTNAGNNNFQVVAGGIGSGAGNALQVTGSNGDKGNRFIYGENLNAFWSSRAATNNIIEVNWSFYTGPVTTSKNTMRGYLYNPDKTKVLAGVSVEMNTRILTPIAYYQGTDGLNNYGFTIGGAPIVLEANTWYTIGMSFNSTTGDIIFRTADGLVDATIGGAAAGENPFEFNIIATAGGVAATPNTVASNGLFDNLLIRTSSTDTLLGVADVVAQTASISVYPNPATDVVNIAGADISKVKFTDINGRTVKSLTVNSTETAINISDLSSGIYMMSLETTDGATTTKKLLKK